jgi:serpin B
MNLKRAKKRCAAVSILASACIAATALTAAASAHAQAAAATASSGTENALALDLYKKLSTRPSNLLLSPYGIGQLVDMVYAGAKGDTAAEIAGVLHQTAPAKANDAHPDANLAAIKHTTEEQPEDVTFHVANALWVAQNVKLNPDFSKTIQQDFKGTAQRVDFSDPQASANTINRWTRKNTDGTIDSIVDANMFSPIPRFVLTDAVYFKGRWRLPFEESDTVKRSFHVAPATTVQSEMMTKSGYYDFAQVSGAKVLVLHYDGSASMVIVLPDRQDGLADLEAGLTSERLDTWLARVGTRPAEISIPKFQGTTSIDLVDTLKSLGMRKAFIPEQADFTGIAQAPDSPLYIGTVVHKAFIETDEHGTEAFAVTAATGWVGAAAPPQNPAHFVADHPFLYFIRDDTSGAILFIGRVADPTKRDD